MNKKLFAISGLLFCICFAHAQNAGKLDLRLNSRLKQQKYTGQNQSLIVKGDLNKVQALCKKFGGTYKYGYNNIASVSIPEKNVIAFASSMEIQKIQPTAGKGLFLMDTARIRNNIDSVNAGIPPLQDSLLGKNVLIGIIDGGIYWQHPDFKNADGSTRIRYIWDQTVYQGSNPPIPYGYGNEWSWQDINNGNCTEVEADGVNDGGCPADYSHGTCVAGIAAGNGSSVQSDSFLQGKYTGVAPESNLIIVNMGTNYNGAYKQGCSTVSQDFLSAVSDAVDYIFKKASALGLPCVINTSVGTYYGSHDGNDLTTQLIEAELQQTSGRVLVAAAGNGGAETMHLSYQIPSDSTNPAYTYFDYNANDGYVYFDLWADSANFNNAWFTVGCNDITGFDYGTIGYQNVPITFAPTADTGLEIDRPLIYGSTTIATVQMLVTPDSNLYHVEFLIQNPTNAYIWRLQTYGQGTFDLWASSDLIGYSNVLNYLPGDTVYIGDPNYRHSDSLKTIVSSWQCSSKVITVGNYSNRAGYLDADSQYVDLTLPANGGEVVGKIFATSSLGPTRDNRLKPDVMATGSTILCTGDLNDIQLKLNNNLAYKVALGSKDERNGGTSMASPIVAGIAALYLQKRPTATWNEVMQALICTAVQDSFTGAVPNYSYGNGKVNAFAAITRAPCIIYGATDTACINYSSTATIDTGGCIPKVYGCMDTAATNYDAAANVSSGNCMYPSGINNISSGVTLQVIPNPFSTQTTFSLLNNGYYFSKGEIEIFDQLGNEISNLPVNSNTSYYIYNSQKLPAGFYYYSLKLDDKNVKTGKLIVE